MSVILSEEQLMLRESAQTFLADQSPVTRMRELRDAVDENGYTPAIWSQMADLGWLGILLAEEHGGSGMGVADLGVVLWECGKVLAPEPLKENRYYVVAGRMGAGTGQVPIELFINDAEPVASKPFPVNPVANSSKLAIGQERDATNHPGRESFDGELARFLIYERPLTEPELRQMVVHLKQTYAVASD